MVQRRINSRPRGRLLLLALVLTLVVPGTNERVPRPRVRQRGSHSTRESHTDKGTTRVERTTIPQHPGLQALQGSFSAVGLAQISHLQQSCTAVSIDGGLVLTAAHCFFAEPNDDDWPRKWLPRYPFQVATTTDEYVVTWGSWWETSGKLIHHKVTKVALEYTMERDFAVLRVDPAPPDSIPLSCDHVERDGRRIGILHHPSSPVLFWSDACTSVAWHAEMFPPEFALGSAFIGYDCSTEEGSSGAPVFEVTPGTPAVDGGTETAPTARLIGVHAVAGACDTGKLQRWVGRATWCEANGQRFNVQNGGMLVSDDVLCKAVKDLDHQGADGGPTLTLPVDLQNLTMQDAYPDGGQ